MPAPPERPGAGADEQVAAGRAGPVRNSGSTSSTTWYWFSCVNMVEICRWPKAS